jgi:hypothetical protein
VDHLYSFEVHHLCASPQRAIPHQAGSTKLSVPGSYIKDKRKGTSNCSDPFKPMLLRLIGKAASITNPEPPTPNQFFRTLLQPLAEARRSWGLLKLGTHQRSVNYINAVRS